MAEEEDGFAASRARGPRAEAGFEHIAMVVLPVEFNAAAELLERARRRGPRRRRRRISCRRATRPATSLRVRSRSERSLRRAPASRARMGNADSSGGWHASVPFGSPMCRCGRRKALLILRHLATVSCPDQGGLAGVAALVHSVAKMPQDRIPLMPSNLTTAQVFAAFGESSWLNLAHLEQTIAAPLEFTGVGLHSGAPVTMRLLPAPAGSGIVFRRTDLDNFEIPATGRNVAKVSYATSLMRQGVLISTTEHLLSALIGMGVDNVIVELDNLELPILDGSALPYVEAFQRVGIREQRRRRETMRVLQPVEVREGDKFIGVYPGSGYRISYTIDFPAPIGQQKSLRGPGRGDVWIDDCAGAHLWLQGRRAASCATWG